MTVITIVAVICAAAVSIAALHLVGRQLREHARERNLMLNQLLHLAGRTWQSPPSFVDDLPEAIDPDEDLIRRFETSPTQMPDY